MIYSGSYPLLMVNPMIDKDKYIEQQSNIIRKKELKIKDLCAQNAKLVLENALYADELNKTYDFLKRYNLLESYKVFKENNYV